MSGYTTKRVYMNKRNVDIGGGVDKTGIPSSTGVPIMLRRFIQSRVPDSLQPPAPSSTSRSGSLLLNGTASSNILIQHDSDLSFDGDFTVEWFQYQTDVNLFPRIFQIGSYSIGINFGVSIEGGQFYLWINNSAQPIDNIDSDNYKNMWVHFAIVRKNGTIKVYMNGNQIGSSLINNGIINTGTETLCIGNETIPSDNASFGGYITNFRWTKGLTVYDGNFTVPSASLTKLAQTKILILAEETNPFATYKTATTINNIAWDSKTPF